MCLTKQRAAPRGCFVCWYSWSPCSMRALPGWKPYQYFGDTELLSYCQTPPKSEQITSLNAARLLNSQLIISSPFLHFMAMLCKVVIQSYLASETAEIKVLFPSSWRCWADNAPPYDAHSGRWDRDAGGAFSLGNPSLAWPDSPSQLRSSHWGGFARGRRAGLGRRLFCLFSSPCFDSEPWQSLRKCLGVRKIWKCVCFKYLAGLFLGKVPSTGVNFFWVLVMQTVKEALPYSAWVS